MAFPDHIDNTIVSSAKRCMTQARYAYIEDLSLPGDSVHLHFGGAVAYGLETARRAFYNGGLPPRKAVELGAEAAWTMYGDFEPPHKSPKTREGARRAIIYYFLIWPMENDVVQPIRLNDKSLGVEWRFKIPIPGLVHPDHGGPIYFVGRSDMLAELRSLFAVEDDKTATQLGEKWAGQWQLDSQFMGYIWAAQQEGLILPTDPGQALIRGIGVYTPKYRKPGNETASKNVTQEMIDSGAVVYDLESSFGHSQAIVHHAPWMIDRWLREFKRVIDRMIYAYLNDPDGTKGEWDMALDKNACGAYGGCAYTDLCMSEKPEQWKAINFIKRKWDPLATV
jgi:hypothetical protein